MAGDKLLTAVIKSYRDKVWPPPLKLIFWFVSPMDI